MASRSIKHDEFVANEMGDKVVKALSGIGPVSGGELSNEGHCKAYQVLGKLVSVEEDETAFDDWLQDNCGAKQKQRKDCFDCLKEWCDNNRRSADT